MLMKFFVLVIILDACLGLISYDGFRVIELNLQDRQEMDMVFNLAEKYQADIWKGPSTVISTHVMISPETFNDFVHDLKMSNITYKIIIEDVQESIDNEKYMNSNARYSDYRIQRGPVVTDHFATFEEIMIWADYLAAKHSFVSTDVYGKSYEGRELRYIKISTGTNRKAVLMDGGIHAREWLAVSTVTYILEKMISDYVAKKPNIVALLSKYDFYFIPVFNPDGYVHSHTNGNRLWRKNRKPNNANGRVCYGTDLNRNFDAAFGGAGTSSNPCADTFRGPYAFSEPETRRFSAFVLSLGLKLNLYMSIHAYAQFWFVPYGYGNDVPADDNEMRRVANIGNKALYNVNRVRFTVGTPPQLLYAAAGGAYDWIKMKTSVKYTYTLEVRPSWGSVYGQEGFIAPVTDIAESGEEMYAGLIATAEAIMI